MPHPVASAASPALSPELLANYTEPLFKVALARVGAPSLLFPDYFFAVKEMVARGQQAFLHCTSVMVTLWIPRVSTI